MLKLKNYSLIFSGYQNPDKTAGYFIDIINLINSNDYIFNFFKSKISYKKKQEIIDNIISNFNLSIETKKIAYDIFINNIKYIKYIKSQLEYLIRKLNNIKRISVTSSYELDNKEMNDIKDKFGLKNEYIFKNDKSILFGLILQIDNKVYNYSACEDFKKIK